ncbi:iron ABC transporter permease [Enterococcus faecalis]|nr:iron ABC transporter permease [Enterococcus faecalis]
MKGISGFYRHQWQVLLVCLFLLLGTMLLSLMFGATSVSIQTIIDSFTHFDATNQAHQVIQTVRLPRILGAAFVGASLAVSGALAQGITQNPLADSGLLGYQCWGWLGLGACFCFPPSGKLLVAFSCFFSWCRRECGTDLLSF